MIDAPAPPPSTYAIEQKLQQCGLKAGGLTVVYRQELQSIEIIIDEPAGATKDMFGCIRQAAGPEVVTYKNAAMQQAYADQQEELDRQKMLAYATTALEKRGLLAGFPARSDFASNGLFAQALEQRCGGKPGEFLMASRDGVMLRSAPEAFDETRFGKMTCLVAELIYVSARDKSFKIDMIGNAAPATDK
ncbi:hypothetical protein [Novosphingobium rosa]|uniref:hypothetical protein n=1 Tax=Novosphingobium rosa TaxID=76978 RepID=UPI00082CEC43|nr:hypothetical protein [Novosphingobium rosa]